MYFKAMDGLEAESWNKSCEVLQKRTQMQNHQGRQLKKQKASFDKESVIS